MTKPYRNILEQIERASFRHDGETDRAEFADEYRADGLSITLSKGNIYPVSANDYETVRGTDTRDHKGPSLYHWPPLLRVHNVQCTEPGYMNQVHRRVLLSAIDGLCHRRGWYFATQWGTHYNDADSHRAISTYVRHAAQRVEGASHFCPVELGDVEYAMQVYCGRVIV